MNAPLTVSEELKASARRMVARTWRDSDAQAFEQGAIPTRPANGQTAARPVAVSNCRAISRFLPRRCRRRFSSEERIARRNRKRNLGGSSALPDKIRHHCTEGERAALAIVFFEIDRQWRCELSIDEIADRAGVGRTTVQNALHEARRLGHIHITERRRRGAKNLTNIIRVISAECLAWIKRGKSASRAIGANFSKNVSTTEIKDLRKKEAWQGQGGERPPDPSPGGQSNAL
jgi:hypothetical protein